MKVKITTEDIYTAFNVVRDTTPINKKTLKLMTVKEALNSISGKYFWIPVFQLLMEAELIMVDLKVGNLLIFNSLAFLVYEWSSEGAGRLETHYITEEGYDFLLQLIHQTVWTYEDELLPYTCYLPDAA